MEGKPKARRKENQGSRKKSKGQAEGNQNGLFHKTIMNYNQ
jgi:hypothetical protein